MYADISESNFTKNKGSTRGGALSLYSISKDSESTAIRKSNFIENEGKKAGAIYLMYSKNINISECSFLRNKG